MAGKYKCMGDNLQLFNDRKTNRLTYILLACINHFTTVAFFALQLKNIKIYNLQP
jgi:hypothetical protein